MESNAASTDATAEAAASDITSSSTTPETTSPEVLAEKYRDNEYVRRAGRDGLHYTDAFYTEMYRLSHKDGMTYAQAYESMGFDIKELGYRRAAQAGYRSAKFVLDRFCYDRDDTFIDVHTDSGLSLADLGVSATVKDAFDIDMAEREEFLERVLTDVVRLLSLADGEE